MSAQVCMAGLFPPQDKQVWNPNLNWQPIPVHTVSDDHLFYPWEKCQRFNETESERTPEIQSIFQQNKSLFSELESKSGDKLNTIDDYTRLYDRLSVGHQIKSDWYV